MKSIKALLAICTAVVHVTTAAPALTISTADGDYLTPASPLFNRGDNFCSPTGPASCNFYITSWTDFFGSGYRRSWRVFDYACNQIGGGSLGPGQDHSLTSQLPFTIELHVRGGIEPRYGHFWYAGTQTSLDGMYCEGCSDITAASCCRIAFTCR